MVMQENNQIMLAFLAVVVLFAGTLVWGFNLKTRLVPDASFPAFSSTYVAQSACLDQGEIENYIEELSRDTTEATEAAQKLFSLAKTSPERREKTVHALIRAMDKPNLDFLRDRESFFLWSNGAAILGELGAVEALDLLIDRANLHDGLFSASMHHQPAIGGIIAMGGAAVPKLSDALRHNQNRDKRLAVALCLGSIGGQPAMDALKQALATEPDQCVRRFIELLFEYPTDEVLRQRLQAFRCGN